jgi:uncharacterized coiled-coil protein SlyX
MTSTELKDLVKAHFNLVEADVIEETNETFGELKDENGAFTLRFPGDSLQVGDKVTVVTAEGQEMDAPDGEHRLEDGTRIVTKDSVVTEITSADGEKAMEEETKEEMASEEETEMAEHEEEKMEEVEEKLEEAEAKIEDIVEAIVSEVKDEMAKVKEEMAALKDKVEKMEALPAAEPTKTSTGKKMGAAKRGFKAFNVEESLNADRIKMALAEIKNKK